MSYGLQIRNANNVIQLDSTKQGFEIVDVIVINDNNSSGTRNYPNLAGATVKLFYPTSFYAKYPGSSASDITVTLNYSNGYPSVTWSYNDFFGAVGDSIYVMVDTLPSSGYGFKFINDNNTVLLTEAFSSYSLIESKVAGAVNVMPATNSYASFFFGSYEGDWAFEWHTHEAVFYNIPAGADPIFLAEIPAYPNGVQIRNILISGTTYTVKCIGYGVAPKIFAFVRQTSRPPAASSFGLRLYNSSQQITTDTASGIFCTTHSIPAVSVHVDVTTVDYVNLSDLPGTVLSTARSCRTAFEVRMPGAYALFEPDYIRKVYQKVWSKASATQLRCDSRLFWTTTVFRGSGDIDWSFTSDCTTPMLITDMNAYL